MPPYIAPYMIPESITIAVVGSRPNEIGNNNTMPSEGPIPGSAPMTCPTSTPTRTNKRFVGVSAIAKPWPKSARVSIVASARAGRLDSEHSPWQSDIEPQDKDQLDHSDGQDRGDEARKQAPPLNEQQETEHEDRRTDRGSQPGEEGD